MQVAKTQQKTVTQWLSSKEWADAITKLVPENGVPAKRFVQSAIVCVASNRSLQQCNSQSLFNVLKDCASLGIDVSPTRGEAYIIPYANVATLQLGFKGLIALGYRSGQFKVLMAGEVREGDTFEVEIGSNNHFTHKPNAFSDKKVIGYYCYVKLANGEELWETMSVAQVEHVKSLCGAKGSAAWKNFFDEMAKKTVIKRLLKKVPSNFEELNAAIEIDDKVNAVESEPIDITNDATVQNVTQAKQAPEVKEVKQEAKPEVKKIAPEVKQAAEVKDEPTAMDKVREEYKKKDQERADAAMEIKVNDGPTAKELAERIPIDLQAPVQDEFY